MKKRYYGLFPILLILSFYLGRQAQQFLRRAESKSEVISDQVLLEEVSAEYLKTEKGSNQLVHFFNEPYSKSDVSIYEKELRIMQRLRILQKMASANSISPHIQWLPVLQKILQNPKEEWVVQRQALKTLHPYWPHFSEKERDRLLSQIDLRAKTTWHLSDKEFVQLFEKIP